MMLTHCTINGYFETYGFAVRSTKTETEVTIPMITADAIKQAAV